MTTPDTVTLATAEVRRLVDAVEEAGRRVATARAEWYVAPAGCAVPSLLRCKAAETAYAAAVAALRARIDGSTE